MMMQDDLLVLVQRPLNGYLSRTKTGYRVDSDGNPTDTLMEHARVPVLGHNLRQAALWHAHSSTVAGHQGYPGVMQSLSRNYYWPKMARDARAYCADCRLCRLAKQGQRERHRLLTSAPPPEATFQCIYLDLVQVATAENSRSYEGHTHILTMTDRLSRFVRLVPIRFNLTAHQKQRATYCILITVRYIIYNIY